MADPTARRRQRRGEGTIYTTKDGRLRAAITVPHALTGEPVRRYLSGRTDVEIRRKLREARAERGTLGTTPTLATWAERWLRLVRHRLRPATLATYRTALRHHIIPALGHAELARLRPSDVEALTARMIEAGAAASTAALTRRVLVVCLTDAARDGLIARNVAALARAPRSVPAHRRVLTAGEIKALATDPDPVVPLALLAVATGLRRGELLALRWADIEPDRNALHVHAAVSRTASGGYAVGEPKTRRSTRTVGLPALARLALERQREAQERDRAAIGSAWQGAEDGLIFTDPLGRPWHPESVTSMWRSLAKRSGLAPTRLHDLRHTTATLALAAGVPVRDVADLLGHGSPSITLDIYGQAVVDGPRRITDALDRVLG